jgi:hypothetical protein
MADVHTRIEPGLKREFMASVNGDCAIAKNLQRKSHKLAHVAIRCDNNLVLEGATGN